MSRSQAKLCLENLWFDTASASANLTLGSAHSSTCWRSVTARSGSLIRMISFTGNVPALPAVEYWPRKWSSTALTVAWTVASMWAKRYGRTRTTWSRWLPLCHKARTRYSHWIMSPPQTNCARPYSLPSLSRTTTDYWTCHQRWCRSAQDGPSICWCSPKRTSFRPSYSCLSRDWFDISSGKMSWRRSLSGRSKRAKAWTIPRCLWRRCVPSLKKFIRSKLNNSSISRLPKKKPSSRRSSKRRFRWGCRTTALPKVTLICQSTLALVPRGWALVSTPSSSVEMLTSSVPPEVMTQAEWSESAEISAPSAGFRGQTARAEWWFAGNSRWVLSLPWVK